MTSSRPRSCPRARSTRARSMDGYTPFNFKWAEIEKRNSVSGKQKYTFKLLLQLFKFPHNGNAGGGQLKTFKWDNHSVVPNF